MKAELTSQENALRETVVASRLDDVQHLADQYVAHIEHRLASSRMTAQEIRALADRAHAVLTETQALATTIRERWSSELARIRSIHGYAVRFGVNGRSSTA